MGWTEQEKRVAIKELIDTQTYIRSITMQAHETNELNPAEVIAQLLGDVDFLARVVQRIVEALPVDD